MTTRLLMVINLQYVPFRNPDQVLRHQRVLAVPVSLLFVLVKFAFNCLCAMLYHQFFLFPSALEFSAYLFLSIDRKVAAVATE